VGSLGWVEPPGPEITGFVGSRGAGGSVALRASARVEEGCVCNRAVPRRVRDPGAQRSDRAGEMPRASGSTGGERNAGGSLPKRCEKRGAASGCV